MYSESADLEFLLRDAVPTSGASVAAIAESRFELLRKGYNVMSAAAAQKLIPLLQEGRIFWDELGQECQDHVAAINRAALSDGVPKEELILCDGESDLRMLKASYPSTSVSIRLCFYSWGPVIVAAITGDQDSKRRFSTNEFEIPIARDLDGRVVAVFDEGRSFSAKDLTRYFMRSFRRCFPALPLPC